MGVAITQPKEVFVSSNILVVIDVQNEIETEGRPYFIDGVENSLRNGRQILQNAREQGWKIYHVRHLQDGDIFGKSSPFSDYVTGFEKRNNETEFIKSNYSAYSSEEFASRMKEQKENNVVLIGYGTTKCILSTIIDGYHRGQNLTLVWDASGAQKMDGRTSESVHDFAVEILKPFCRIVKTKDFLAETLESH